MYAALEQSLGLGVSIEIEETIYTLVGIDHYQLMNTLGESMAWSSFTISSEQQRLSFSIANDEIVLWQSSNMYTDNKSLRCDYSGMAVVKFDGDQGPSAPLASLLWFTIDDQQHDYFAIESFLEQDAKALESQDIHYFIGRILPREQLKVLL